MARRKDLLGRRFGRYVVVAEAPPTAIGAARWLCECDCGTTRTVRSTSLLSGASRSCGCLQREQLAGRVATHRQTRTPEYRAWISAKRRTSSPRDRWWHRYGGRGISMCAEWLDDFAAFLDHIGPRPGPDYSLDRINNDGNYEPGNVRWATRSQQRRNRSDYRWKYGEAKTIVGTAA